MVAKRILIIEDDEFIQNMLALTFRKEGYEVECADDGQKGFNKAVTEDFDLIVTDIKMPNWSGADSIYGLNLVNNKIKIIVISGYVEDELRAELETYENVVKILSKPFDTFKLIALVRDIFNGKV
jgi:DNA-binding response OmpR family regulator